MNAWTHVDIFKKLYIYKYFHLASGFMKFEKNMIIFKMCKDMGFNFFLKNVLSSTHAHFISVGNKQCIKCVYGKRFLSYKFYLKIICRQMDRKIFNGHSCSYCKIFLSWPKEQSSKACPKSYDVHLLWCIQGFWKLRNGRVNHAKNFLERMVLSCLVFCLSVSMCFFLSEERYNVLIRNLAKWGLWQFKKCFLITKTLP